MLIKGQKETFHSLLLGFLASLLLRLVNIKCMAAAGDGEFDYRRGARWIVESLINAIDRFTHLRLIVHLNFVT